MASLQLVFPPLTGVNYPYLSTPAAAAFLACRKLFESTCNPLRKSTPRCARVCAFAQSDPVMAADTSSRSAILRKIVNTDT